MTKTKKRDRKINRPEPTRYPHVIEESEKGKLIAYSRNHTCWIPAKADVRTMS